MKLNYKQFTIFILVSFIMMADIFANSHRVLKSNIVKHRMRRIEPDVNIQSVSRESCPSVFPSNMNDYTWFTLIDSSANGYGMVSSVTRPIDVNVQGKWALTFRQFIAENYSHGQLGSAVSNNGMDWTVHSNINNDCPGGGWPSGFCQAGRYPSVISTQNHPYVIWNEYVGGGSDLPPDCSTYGGRPFYSFDHNGFMGNDWVDQLDIDPFWDCTKAFWNGSVGYGYDAVDGETHISAVFDDWSRDGNYLFRSDAVVDGYIVFNPEVLIVNPNHLGTNGFSSEATLSMNDNGQGILGLIGILDGVDMDAETCNPPASNTTCNIAPLFKLTDDWGETWQGDHAANDFYYVPDEVYDDILSYWPSVDVDQCTGEQFGITDFWSWYEFDIRVDMNGNPHFVISMVAESENYFHFLNGYTGFYHFTIDRNYIDNPGSVNSLTGWNWSFIPVPANDSFRWNRPDGYSYLWGAMCQLSLSRENPDIVYVVANIGAQGEMNTEYDEDGNGFIDDPCQLFNAPYELYPNWSEDIWVAVSEDGGLTWTGLLNVTKTPRNGINDECSPEEQYVHTAHWSTDDEVKFMYQQPDWSFNEIGDPLGIDHKNRIFAGNASILGIYDECWMYFGYDGDVSLDYEVNILDIVILANHILLPNLEGCSLEMADINNDGELNMLDIIAIVNIILDN